VRVLPSELQAVKSAGMLTRYALLGPVAYVLVDLPRSGTVGTGLDAPCLTDHHGVVTRGTFSVHHEDGRDETFDAGEAFYVPSGPPAHHFTSSPDCVVGGFVAIQQQPDTSPDALQALGLTVVTRPAAPVPPPTRIRLAGSIDPFRRKGSIDVEGSRMGDWLFLRAAFGPRSGFAGGWCDAPHWGLVIDGEITITYADGIDLATRGDVYYSPPGHRFSSPDGATFIDYTPIDHLDVPRLAAWRRAAVGRAPGLSTPTERSEPRHRASQLPWPERAAIPFRLRPAT
jgi:hypothetical protein